MELKVLWNPSGSFIEKKIEFLEKRSSSWRFWCVRMSEALGAWKSWVVDKPEVRGRWDSKPIFNKQKNYVIKNTTCKEKAFLLSSKRIRKNPFFTSGLIVLFRFCIYEFCCFDNILCLKKIKQKNRRKRKSTKK